MVKRILIKFFTKYRKCDHDIYMNMYYKQN